MWCHSSRGRLSRSARDNSPYRSSTSKPDINESVAAIRTPRAVNLANLFSPYANAVSQMKRPTSPEQEKENQPDSNSEANTTAPQIDTGIDIAKVSFNKSYGEVCPIMALGTTMRS